MQELQELIPFVFTLYIRLKLLVDALPKNTSSKALFVWDDKNTECIMRQCDQWPDDSELKAFLCELLQGFDDISFK